jgi:hypothetical protein
MIPPAPRPAELDGQNSFSGLKVKLIASIVAISAIELLKAFVNVSTSALGDAGTGRWQTKQLAWSRHPYRADRIRGAVRSHGPYRRGHKPITPTKARLIKRAGYDSVTARARPGGLWQDRNPHLTGSYHVDVRAPGISRIPSRYPGRDDRKIIGTASTPEKNRTR